MSEMGIKGQARNQRANTFFCNMLIAEEEDVRLVLEAELLIQYLQFISELAFPISTTQRDFEDVVASSERCQLGERLFPASTNFQNIYSFFLC